MAYKLVEILRILKIDFQQIGDCDTVFFCDVRPILEAGEQSLVFITDDAKNIETLLELTKAKVIICGKTIDIQKEYLQTKCFIRVKNPRLVIKKICDHIWGKAHKCGVEPTSYVDHDADIGENTYVGHFSYVGKCKIGKNVIIGDKCIISDNVIIGNNVTIQAGTVIGCQSFNFIEDDNQKKVLFPQIGGVIIRDDVHIGINTYISRGSLGDTEIDNEVKIYGNVTISHNVKIGCRSMIYPNVFIAGSTIIGKDTRIYMSSSIKDHIVIGDKSIVSMGSIVTHNVSNNEVFY